MRFPLRARRRAVVGAVVLTLAVSAHVRDASGRGTTVPEVPPAGADRSWISHLMVVDAALDRQDARGAIRAWHQAYTAALGSRSWEGMVDVGAAYLRLGAMTGMGDAARHKARYVYQVALFRAEGQRSVEGLLRVAEAFAALGDRAVADQCMKIASGLAAGDPDATARVRAFSERSADTASALPAPGR